jgi:hypothetical protein
MQHSGMIKTEYAWMQISDISAWLHIYSSIAYNSQWTDHNIWQAENSLENM